MNLKIRRLIFYTLIITFFVLAFFIIPYSNGWRFDFNTFTFVKLGGLYLNVEPTEATVQVDKLSFEIKSTFMKSGLLIANLFPKTYHVSIQKDGYQPWNKNLTIKPSLVTQIYPIILIPNKNNTELVENNVKDLFPNINYLAWKDTNNHLKIDDKIIKGTVFLNWLAGEKSALVYDDTTKNYLIINPAQNNSALNINLLFENLKYQRSIDDKNSIKKILAYPLDKNKLVLSTSKNLYILDFYKPSLELIDPLAYGSNKELKNDQYDLLGISGEEIFFTNLNNLFYYNLNKGEGDLLLADQKNINALEVSPNNQFLALISNSKLIILDRSKNENNITDLLVENPIYYKFSPDSKKIATVYGNKIKITFIGDDYELFNKEPMGSSIFEINSIDQNFPMIWHNNSYYLYVKSGTTLKFLEINDDQPINLQTIDTDVNKYFYNKQENFLYLIKNESLYKVVN
ncbi:MAG: hypothetical protein ACYC3G_01940 [Minisyncoccota bacterium]